MKKNESPIVLIVDDIKQNLQILGDRLRQEGYRVAAASNGKDALEIVSKTTPDLILLDIMMPEMDGFEVCQRLKKNAYTKDIPVFFLTAKTDIESITRGFEVGAVDYLTKPFNKAELSMRLNTHLKLRSSYKRLEDLNEQLEKEISARTQMATMLEESEKRLQAEYEKRKMEARLKASLKEKEILLQEVHHRVKNNLQVISSLLGMQAKNISDPKLYSIFEESQNRVKSMAFIHERLYQSEGLDKVDFFSYAQQLANHLFHTYGANKEQIKLSIDIQNIHLDVDTAIPCGMIINEALSNSLKYAFPDQKSGEILVTLQSTDTDFFLKIRDDGTGFSLPKDCEFKNSLGLKLIHLFTKQLSGKIEFDQKKGTTLLIQFPRELS